MPALLLRGLTCDFVFLPWVTSVLTLKLKRFGRLREQQCLIGYSKLQITYILREEHYLRT